MQDSSINIVQEGVQRETSNTKPQVQSVKTYQRQTCLVQQYFFSKSVLQIGITLAKANALLNFWLFLVGEEITLSKVM